MLTIITVTWNSYDFLGLLLESLQFYTHLPYEVIVVDNSDKKHEVDQLHVHQFYLGKNIGHGAGLNYGVEQAWKFFPYHPFMMFLDVDCHMLRHHWDVPFVKKMEHFDLVGGKGVAAKPIRPACMFMKSELAIKYDWQETEGYRGSRPTATPNGFDVAIRAYHQIVADHRHVELLPTRKSRYGTLNGEEFCIEGIPVCYHHWHGASLHLPCRQADFPDADLIQDKLLLFSKIPWRLP